MIRSKLAYFARHAVLEAVLLAMCVVLAFKAEGFTSGENLMNILRNCSMQGIIAFGMIMVIIAGEIDLSVGSMVAFSGCLSAYIINKYYGGKAPADAVFVVCAAIGASLAAGFLSGCFSGLMRTWFLVPTFITTLAWMTVLSGLAFRLNDGFSLQPFPDWYCRLGSDYLFGWLPIPALIFLAVFAVIHTVMNYTAFGRSLYAVGGNAEAARLSGIRVGRVKILAMGIVGALAALAGILQSAQIQSGTPTTGTGWELDVISAVIIGGASLMGGYGKVWGAFVGVVFLGVLSNGMTLLAIAEDWQRVVRGALILAAVLVNQAQLRQSRGRE